MDKKQICNLLRYGIIYAKHTMNDLQNHKKFTAKHREVINDIEQYIHRCQQIINDNSTDDE
jgi:cell division protein ZapA (FtsZ GTPase activity inhibitor)